MVFPGIAIDANREATAIMTDNTSKASCGLNLNPALCIDKLSSMPGLWHSFSNAGSNADAVFFFYELFVTSCFN